jgi:hypothetical protein
MVLLPLGLECQDYRCVPPQLAMHFWICVREKMYLGEEHSRGGVDCSGHLFDILNVHFLFLCQLTWTFQQIPIPLLSANVFWWGWPNPRIIEGGLKRRVISKFSSSCWGIGEGRGIWSEGALWTYLVLFSGTHGIYFCNKTIVTLSQYTLENENRASPDIGGFSGEETEKELRRVLIWEEEHQHHLKQSQNQKPTRKV